MTLYTEICYLHEVFSLECLGPDPCQTPGLVPHYTKLAHDQGDYMRCLNILCSQKHLKRRRRCLLHFYMRWTLF